MGLSFLLPSRTCAAGVDAFRVDPHFAPIVTSVRDIGPVFLYPLGNDGVVVSGSIFAVGDELVDSPGHILMREDGSVERVDLPHGSPRFVFQDGSWLANGTEPVPGSSPVRHYLRLYEADGTLDPDFRLDLTPATWTDAARAPGGKVVLSNMARDDHLAFRVPVERYNPDGSRDTSFVCGITDAVRKIAVDPQGRVLTYANTQRPDTAIRLLDTNGAVDTSLSVELSHGSLDRLLALSDGSWLLFGRSVSISPSFRYGFARMLADGSVAENYTGLPDSGSSFLQARLLSDGRLVLLNRVSGSESGFGVVLVPADGGEPSITIHRLVTGLGGSGFAGAISSDGSSYIAGSLVGVRKPTGIMERGLAGIVRFLPDGSLDDDFSGTLGRSGHVRKVAALPGGRTLIAGQFDGVNGVVMPEVAILMPDGTLDASFVPLTASLGTLIDAVGLGDGSVVMAGQFQSPTGPGAAPIALVRLLADGTRDAAFDGHFPYDFMSGTSIGTTHDGRLLVSRHSLLDARPSAPRITRFNTDGSIDTGFDVRMPSASGASFAAHPDGSVFVRGHTDITDADGVTRSGWVRIGEDGRFVPGFAAPEASATYRLLVGPGGHVLAVGSFTSIDGMSRPGLARLLDDGSVDPSYAPLPGGHDAFVVAADGSALVATGTEYTKYIRRLDATGTLDSAFQPRYFGDFPDTIESASARANGDIVIGGKFTHLGDHVRPAVARLGSNAFQAWPSPRRLEIPEGGTGFVSLDLVGVGFHEVQWFKDGQPVPEGDHRILAVRGATPADAGRYVAEVTSGGAVVRTEAVEVVLGGGTRIENLGTLDFAGSGGVGGVFVHASPDVAWDVGTVPAWMQVEPGPGSGSGTFRFVLARNDTGAPRSAQVVVAGQAFTVDQAAGSSRLMNISTRGRAGVGDETLIAGFVCSGAEPIGILGRAVGPTLQVGFGLNGVLPDPVVGLYRGGDRIGENDEWDVGVDRDEIALETARVGGFELEDGLGDAALLVALPAAGYTMQVSDAIGRSGVALAELYDRTDPQGADAAKRLMNISTRGYVGAGDEVLIAGFVIGGPVPKQVLIRGAGPSLAEAGIGNPLRDPHLRLVQDGQTLATNDDWSHSTAAEWIDTAAIVAGAFQFEFDNREAAIVATLAPGAYTVILSGADGGTGVALVEVYDLE
ncbi:hypothetical protein ASA1KI_44010 [Opitutales bacterium ASA1]|nr:hypothetical protein ASA1KI_44010 [Opitutales bacterium ASA1]